MQEKNSPAVQAELSNEDLQAISESESQAVPNVQFFGKTAFTIENAPIPKSINAALGVEKKFTVELKVRMDRTDRTE